MKHLLLFFSLFISISSFAETITATVTAYNKAELSGDVAPEMFATFDNTYHSKGSVRKDDIAALTISGWETCTIEQIAVYVKSNKTAGAGTLTVKTDEQTLLTRNGNYKDWKDAPGYSGEYLPFTESGQWLMAQDASLTLTLEGSANSLHLEKIVIRFSPAEPQPLCLHFEWRDNGVIKTTTICETEAAAGLQLPDLQQEELASVGNFTLVGWSEQQVEEPSSTVPDYHPINKTFYPRRETTLYPVYKQQSPLQLVEQDALRQDGEYVVAREFFPDEWYMMTGDVKNNYLQTTPCFVETDEDGTHYLAATAVPAQCRYLLRFEYNQVYITNKYSEQPIGYYDRKLANSADKSWLVEECLNHSVFLVNAQETDGSAYGLYQVTVFRDGKDIDYFGAYRLVNYTSYEILFLFEVTGLPEEDDPILYCSYPTAYTPIRATDMQTQQKIEKIIENDKIILIHNGIRYDALGRKIR